MVIINKVKNQHGQREQFFFFIVTERRHVTHDRQSEKRSEIKAFCDLAAKSVRNRKDIQKSLNSSMIPPTLQLQIQGKEEDLRRKKKAGCHGTHEDDAFSGDGSGTRLTFRREAPSWLSRSEFKNRLSLEINKSRSSGGCEIRQASVPPPLLSNQGNALPLSLHIY